MLRVPSDTKGIIQKELLIKIITGMKKLFTLLIAIVLFSGMGRALDLSWTASQFMGGAWVGDDGANVVYYYNWGSGNPYTSIVVCFVKANGVSLTANNKTFLFPPAGTYQISASEAAGKVGRYQTANTYAWVYNNARYCSFYNSTNGTQFKYYTGNIVFEEGNDGPYVHGSGLQFANNAFTQVVNGTHSVACGTAATYYNVTVKANNNSYGTATPAYKSGYVYANNRSKEYKKNSVYTLTATETAGVFVEWQKNGSRISGDKVVDVTITGNATYTAVFEAASDGTITVNAGSNGQVKLGSGSWGSTFNHTYNGGESATIAAKADDGYLFYQWTDNANATNTTNPYNFIVSGDKTYTASFKRAYTITTGVNDEAFGSVGITAPYSGGKYYDGQSITLTATPANSFTSFVKWQKDGVDIAGGASLNVTVNANATYTALFSGRNVIDVDIPDASYTDRMAVYSLRGYSADNNYYVDAAFNTNTNALDAVDGITYNGSSLSFSSKKVESVEQPCGNRMITHLYCYNATGDVYHFSIHWAFPMNGDDNDTFDANFNYNSAASSYVKYNSEFGIGAIELYVGDQRPNSTFDWKYDMEEIDLLFITGIRCTDEVMIPAGIYPINCSGEINTVLSNISNTDDYGYVWQMIQNVDLGIKLITSGEVIVERGDNNYYKITVNAKNSYGRPIKSVITGTINPVTVPYHTLNVTTDGNGTAKVYRIDCTDTPNEVNNSGSYIEGSYFKLEATANEGYAFDYWTIDGVDEHFTDNPDVLELYDNAVVTAHFKNAVFYDVTLDPNDGSGDAQTVSAAYGESMPVELKEGGAIQTPTREDYTFDGYVANADGTGTKYYNADLSSAANWDKTEGATLYARWISNTCDVTLDPNGGSGSNQVVSATNGNPMPATLKGGGEIVVSTREGWVFDGYVENANGTGKKYYNADLTSANNWDKTVATTLYARWIRTFTVTIADYPADAGTVTVYYNYGDNAYTSGSTFTSGSQEVKGWDNITAVATANAHYTLTSFTWDGEDFDFRNDPEHEVDEDHIITAVFTAEQYTITYKDQGNAEYSGSNIADLPAQHTYGTPTDLVSGVRTGYTFDGWYEDENCTGSAVTALGETTYTQAITLYAKWTPVTYTITYNAGTYGTGTVAAGAKTHGENFTLSSSTFTREGYTQTGWSTSDDGAKDYDLGGIYTDDAAITLYPYWTQKTYTVHFAVDGTDSYGTVSTSALENVPHASAVTTDNSTLTIDGRPVTAEPEAAGSGYTYAFAEWTTDNNGNAIESDGITYTAHFSRSAVEYTITYEELNGATNSNPATYTVESGDIVLVDPGTRPGYLFKEWQDESGLKVTQIDGGTIGNRTLTAVWDAAIYSITYLDKNGEVYSGKNLDQLPATHTYGTETALVNGEKDGFNFLGWYADASCTGEALTVINATFRTEDFVLYAVWEAASTDNTLTISVDANGHGSVNDGVNGTYTFGSTVTIAAEADRFYEFDEWSDGNQDNPREVTLDRNITLAASFRIADVIELEDNHKTGDSWWEDYSDLLDALADLGIEKKKVRYMRDLPADKWCMFSLPFNYSFRSGSTLKGCVYEMAGAEYTTDGCLYLNFVSMTTQIKANRPYVYKSSTGDIKPLFENVHLETVADGSYSVANTGGVPGSVEFRNTMVYEQLGGADRSDNRHYIYLQNNRLYYPNVNTWMRAFRGYFWLEMADDDLTHWVTPRVRIVVDGEVVTDLEAVQADGAPADGGVRKYVENGVLVIERNGVRYDATGARID